MAPSGGRMGVAALPASGFPGLLQWAPLAPRSCLEGLNSRPLLSFGGPVGEGGMLELVASCGPGEQHVTGREPISGCGRG